MSYLLGLCQSQLPDPSNFQAREFSVGKTVDPLSRDVTAEKAEVIFTCLTAAGNSVDPKNAKFRVRPREIPSDVCTSYDHRNHGVENMYRYRFRSWTFKVKL